MTLTDHLNPKQKEAVETIEGPLLILAGAGSGKTRVLTHRIANIISQKLAYPEEILAVTFTNKAAKEMQVRIEELIGNNIKMPWVGTFHSICVKILRRHASEISLNNSFTIYDSSDQLQAVKESMKELDISEKNFNPKTILSKISSAKNELINSSEYEKYSQGLLQKTVSKIYKIYQIRLANNQALDFDDLIFKTVVLLQTSKKVREKFQTLFRYIHVDEYQDTNHAQYIFTKLLAEKYKNICVVGDDDQSIYSWRGANIKNILSFENDYSNAKIIKLEQNYRSTKNILDASHDIIRINRNRKDKKLWTEKDAGEPIRIYEAMDEQSESNFVVQKTEQLINSGTSADDIAVLYRINAQSRVTEEVLLKYGLPYRIVGNVRFYDRKEIKDIISFVKIIYNPEDDISLKRVINTPARGIGAKSIQNLEEMSKLSKLSIVAFLKSTQDSLSKGLKDFVEIYNDLENASTNMNIFDLLQFIIDRSGYLQDLEKNKEENQSRIENIKELITLATDFTELDPLESLEAFIERVSLYEAQDDIKDKDSERVTLLTVHSAKGLEFKYVFIIGLEEGIFPHSRSYTDPEEMEEERRLAYVAITRAKDTLFLTHARARRFFGSVQTNPRSRFIDDISNHLVESLTSSYADFEEEFDDWDIDNGDQERPTLNVNIGSKVKHSLFGIGTVLSFDDSIIKIDFGNRHGTKELVIEYANLLPV